MLDTYPGKLTLQDGSVLDAALTIGDDTLTVAAGTMEVGTWPLKYCRVSRRSEDEFEVNIDGEMTLFLPQDAYRFGKAAAASFHGSSIADRIGVIRAMPVEPDAGADRDRSMDERSQGGGRGFSWSDIPWRSIGIVGGGIAAVVALAWLAVLIGRIGSNDRDSSVVTVATTVAAGPRSGAFDGTAAEFVAAWNAHAASRDQGMLLEAEPVGGRLMSQLSSTVLLTVDTHPSGTVAGINLSIQPTDRTADSAAAVDAIETAIRVADPALDQFEAAEVLTALGLAAVEDLTLLEGLKAEVVAGEVKYWSLYVDFAGVDEDVLIFAADPIE